MARLPLHDPPPARPPDDPCRRATIEFRSAADGRTCAVDVYAPAEPSGPLPLVIAPHPIGWTAAQEYRGGIEGLVRGYSRGWSGLPDAARFLLAIPHGHAREVELNSLGYGPQVSDLADLIGIVEEAGHAVDRQRVYAAGLSMGAQEALLVAGAYPGLVAGVAVFNPVIDVAAWHDDLKTSSDPQIASYRTWERIELEVGGPPDELPAEYVRRSPLSVVEGLATVPTLVVWSRLDAVVPRQETHHALALRDAILAVRTDAPLGMYEHTGIHGAVSLADGDGWRLHEWCDYKLAFAWLAAHSLTTPRTALEGSTP